MDGTVHRGFAVISVGSQVFTDLDFADDGTVGDAGDTHPVAGNNVL